MRVVFVWGKKGYKKWWNDRKKNKTYRVVLITVSKK